MRFMLSPRLFMNSFYRYFYKFHCIVSASTVVRAKMEIKTAGIVVIGDEVLKGQVADENIYFLAKKLHLLGIKLCKVSIVPDIVDDIAKEVAEYSVKYDRVITTGGIGPTHDDMTYEGIAAAFQDTLVLNEELRSYWSYFNQDPDGRKHESSLKMATIPKTATVIYTELPRSIVPAGRFPVVTVKNVCVFPGIPFYLKSIFNSLQGTYFVPSGVTFYVRRLYLNVFESAFSQQLTEAAKKFEKTVVFGSYPKINNAEYRVVITIESQQVSEVEEALKFFKSLLKPIWIVNDCDILSETWSVTKERMNSGSLELGFVNNLKNSLEVVEKVFDDYSPEEVFLAFNGGKDCTALLHLAHTVRNKREIERDSSTPLPPLTAVYFRPKNPLPEVESFINLVTLKYRINLLIEEGPIRETLDRLTKSDVGSKWKVVLMGTRKADPHGKNLNQFQKTDEGWAHLIRVSPILDWSYKEVWAYLRNFSVSYCSLYDEGYTSLDDSAGGCVPNPTLEYKDENGKVKYRPAYALEDETTERSGRR